MPRTFLALGLAVMLATSLVVSGCNDGCTCKDYEPGTSDATYCRNHREAVWDYVELGSGVDEYRTQIRYVERLLGAIKDCNDTACIKTEIRAETFAPGFAAIFARWNERAEEDVAGAELKRREAILCGLNNGLIDWQDSIKIMEGQQ